MKSCNSTWTVFQNRTIQFYVPPEMKDDHERPALLRVRVRNTTSWDHAWDGHQPFEIRALSGGEIDTVFHTFIWESETVELKNPFNVGNKVLFLNSRIWRSRASFACSNRCFQARVESPTRTKICSRRKSHLPQPMGSFFFTRHLNCVM
jgi:hypothetical protein